MKIAVVTETFSPFRGGSARRYLEVFERIAKAGNEVHLYTARLNPGWPVLEEIGGIVVHRSKRAYPNFITGDGFRSVGDTIRFALWSLREMGKDRPFDLIEANHCPVFPTLASWVRSKMSSTPLSVTFHEVWYDEWYRYVPRRIYAPVGINLERSTTLLPDLAIAVSHTTARRLVKYFHMPQDKIKTISNGVDLGLYNHGEVPREQSKVLFLGRLNPHKKIEWLFKAVQALSNDYPGMTLEVVGDGPMRETYRSYVSSNGLQSLIRFKGALDDGEVARQLRSSYVYVLPSIREGQSITLLEAMAAGTPQIVVKAKGNAAGDLLADSESGLVAPPSSTGIALAISKLLDDRLLWNDLNERSLKYAGEYSWDRI
ncbi:MAG: glycosyltransferase family 4 protein, partial [Thaumarchaeota archaeon]|nr:glycosyltransferase family 4 protein [Nitrososphaerota archaeon]